MKKVISMFRKSFTAPVTGVYSLCKTKALKKDPSEGYPLKAILSAPVIKR